MALPSSPFHVAMQWAFVRLPKAGIFYHLVTPSICERKARKHSEETFSLDYTCIANEGLHLSKDLLAQQCIITLFLWKRNGKSHSKDTLIQISNMQVGSISESLLSASMSSQLPRVCLIIYLMKPLEYLFSLLLQCQDYLLVTLSSYHHVVAINRRKIWRMMTVCFPPLGLLRWNHEYLSVYTVCISGTNFG